MVIVRDGPPRECEEGVHARRECIRMILRQKKTCCEQYGQPNQPHWQHPVMWVAMIAVTTLLVAVVAWGIHVTGSVTGRGWIIVLFAGLSLASLLYHFVSYLFGPTSYLYWDRDGMPHFHPNWDEHFWQDRCRVDSGDQPVFRVRLWGKWPFDSVRQLVLEEEHFRYLSPHAKKSWKKSFYDYKIVCVWKGRMLLRDAFDGRITAFFLNHTTHRYFAERTFTLIKGSFEKYLSMKEQHEGAREELNALSEEARGLLHISNELMDAALLTIAKALVNKNSVRSKSAQMLREEVERGLRHVPNEEISKGMARLAQSVIDGAAGHGEIGENGLDLMSEHINTLFRRWKKEGEERKRPSSPKNESIIYV